MVRLVNLAVRNLPIHFLTLDWLNIDGIRLKSNGKSPVKSNAFDMVREKCHQRRPKVVFLEMEKKVDYLT